MFTQFGIFYGGLTIGQFNNSRENLQWYIDRYEPDFMKRYLTPSGYEQFKSDMESSNPDEKSRGERAWELCKYPCAIYIWCYYTNENQEHQSGTGNVKMKNRNSTVADSSGKIARMWDEMVKVTRENSDAIHDLYNVRCGRFEFNSVLI